MKCECDIEKLTTAGTLFLEGLGIDLTDQHLKDTPQRFARAWAEFFCAGYQEDPAEILNTTFDDECDEMISLFTALALIIWCHFTEKPMLVTYLTREESRDFPNWPG